MGLSISARDRQHLLLAAGELEAKIALASMQLREQLKNPRQGPEARARGAGKGGQVLAHGQARKDAALLRHKTEAEPRNRVRR